MGASLRLLAIGKRNDPADAGVLRQVLSPGWYALLIGSTGRVGWRLPVGGLTRQFKQAGLYCYLYCGAITAHEERCTLGRRPVTNVSFFDHRRLHVEINPFINGYAIIRSKVSHKFLREFTIAPRLPSLFPDCPSLHPPVVVSALVDLFPKVVLNVCLGRRFHFEISLENSTLTRELDGVIPEGWVITWGPVTEPAGRGLDRPVPEVY
jgi:hypothetical protein